MSETFEVEVLKRLDAMVAILACRTSLGDVTKAKPNEVDRRLVVALRAVGVEYEVIAAALDKNSDAVRKIMSRNA
jgi:hypothetical protein